MNSRRAFVSVADKTGIVDFCRGLAALGFEIVSTGGTLKALEAAGVSARQVSEVSGVPEILQGRVKSLHPAIFGGILARRDRATDMDTLQELGIQPIEVVAVNLYPFTQLGNCDSTPEEQMFERIDVGGSALLRAAAKNHRDVYAIVDPADYSMALGALGSGRDADFKDLRRRLAAKVFEHTSRYDAVIHEWFSRTGAAASGDVTCG